MAITSLDHANTLFSLSSRHAPPNLRRDRRAGKDAGRRHLDQVDKTDAISAMRIARHEVGTCVSDTRHTNGRIKMLDMGDAPTSLGHRIDAELCSSLTHRQQVLDLRGSRPGWAVAVCNQQQPHTPPAPTHPLARAPTAR